MTEIDRIAVVGGGTMGNGIAHVCALHGREVFLIDVSPDVLERALTSIEGNLGRQVEKGVVDDEERAMALARIRTRTDLADAVADVDLVVEAVPEKEALKHDVFDTLDRHAPEEAVLASNTSSISITALGGRAPGSGRRDALHQSRPGHGGSWCAARRDRG